MKPPLKVPISDVWYKIFVADVQDSHLWAKITSNVLTVDANTGCRGALGVVISGYIDMCRTNTRPWICTAYPPMPEGFDKISSILFGDLYMSSLLKVVGNI